jgi:hypothetical protein
MGIPPFFLLPFFLSFALMYGKNKNLTLEHLQAGAGSLWTWTAPMPTPNLWFLTRWGSRDIYSAEFHA